METFRRIGTLARRHPVGVVGIVAGLLAVAATTWVLLPGSHSQHSAAGAPDPFRVYTAADPGEDVRIAQVGALLTALPADIAAGRTSGPTVFLVIVVHGDGGRRVSGTYRQDTPTPSAVPS